MARVSQNDQSLLENRVRVLVIDDDPQFRNLLVAMLRRQFFVSVAGDGAEGFRKAQEYPPDIALIDVQMPGLDGLQTLQAFRNSSALSRVKVVMLTADASRETVMAAIRGGALEYIVKTSFNRDELFFKLDRLLKDGQATSSRPTASAVAPTIRATPLDAVPELAVASVSELAEPAVETFQSRPKPELQEVLDSWE